MIEDGWAYGLYSGDLRNLRLAWTPCWILLSLLRAQLPNAAPTPAPVPADDAPTAGWRITLLAIANALLIDFMTLFVAGLIANRSAPVTLPTTVRRRLRETHPRPRRCSPSRQRRPRRKLQTRAEAAWGAGAGQRRRHCRRRREILQRRLRSQRRRRPFRVVADKISIPRLVFDRYRHMWPQRHFSRSLNRSVFILIWRFDDDMALDGRTPWRERQGHG
jgi:hypothetical protein